MQIEESESSQPLASTLFSSHKHTSHLSSDPYLLLDSLIENYLLALPPLDRKWILVPHLSWKAWLERQITDKIGALTSCEITTPDAIITSFSKVRESILSPGEIALLCSSFQNPLEEFFESIPTFSEIQKVGQLLFELGYLQEEKLNSLLKEIPPLHFLQQQLYLNKSPFTPWIRKLSNPLSLKTPIALFQIAELPSSFMQTFEGDISSFCLEPSPHFWADELLRSKKITSHLLPDLFMQFGQVRKSRMKQMLDFDMEIHEQFPTNALTQVESPFDLVRMGLFAIDDELILQGMRASFESSSLQIALVGSPLEEVHHVATLIEKKIHTALKELSPVDPTSESALLVLGKILDEMVILTPSLLSQEYASLLEVELARITPRIPASFEGISSLDQTSLMEGWLSLLSPLGEGSISSLITSTKFFELFEIEIKDHSAHSSILSLFNQKEKKRSVLTKTADPIQDKLELIDFFISTIEEDLFAYQGDEDLMEQFLKKLLDLSSSLRPWQKHLKENQSKPLSEWHAIFEQTAKLFFEDALYFENPLAALAEKAKNQWHIPIECHSMLSFCSIRGASSSSNLTRGVLRVRPFSYSCITPSNTIFLLGMGPDYAGFHNQVFPWLFSKERLHAKTPSSSIQKDTLFDLFLLAKENLVITSSKEESLKEAPLIRVLLSSSKLELGEILTRPVFLDKAPHFSPQITSPILAKAPNESSVIDLNDLLSFAENPLRYSLRKHLSSLSYCPDRKKQIEESFIGKTLWPSDLLKFSEEELFDKREEQKRNEVVKTGLLGSLAEQKIAPFLETQAFIKEGRFDAHFTPLQNLPAWHSSSLLLHPPLPAEKNLQLRGFIEGLHKEGVLLVKNTDASSLRKEKIEKWPLMLIQSILSHSNQSSLNTPKWVVLPSLEASLGKADLHSHEVLEKCFSDLVDLYQKAQTVPCLYTSEWIAASLEKGTPLIDLFQSEIAETLGQGGFGTPSSERSLAMAYAAEKEWFENALALDFTQELKQIYAPLLRKSQETDT